MMKPQEVPQYFANYNKAYSLMLENTNQQEAIEEVCYLRGYIKSDRLIRKELVRSGLVCVPENNTRVIDRLRGFSPQLGLFNSNGHFLLADRYTLPIRDLQGNVLALVGWNLDGKKYITTPSALFSKSLCLY